MNLFGYKHIEISYLGFKKEPIYTNLIIEDNFIQIDNTTYFYKDLDEIEIKHNHGYKGKYIGLDGQSYSDGLGNYIRIWCKNEEIKIFFYLKSEAEFTALNNFLIHLKDKLSNCSNLLFWITDTKIITKLLNEV